MQKRALVGTIFVLVALFMFGLSLIVPWYYSEVKMSGLGISESINIDYYLDHAYAEVPGDSEELSYDNETAEDYHWVQTFKTTQILAFLGVLGCFIGLIGATMVTSEKLNSKAGAVLVLLAVILSLIAPLYLMFTLPNAFEKDAEEETGAILSEDMRRDFFGSGTEELMGMNMEASWGGSTGWFLTIFAAIICIMALIFVAISKPAQVPTIEQMPIPLDMYAQPYDIVPPPQAQFYADQETFPPYPSPLQMSRLQGEDFQCPNCNSIFILTLTKRPAIIRCPYCGLEGLVE